MLHEHRIMDRHNRNGGGELIVGAYSEEQLIAFNQKHDREMGFTFEFPTIYFNVRRLPESSFLPPEKLWSGG